MANAYKLYGTEFSLYTGKVRSYLRKKGLPFAEVLSTVRVYKNFIIPQTGVRYIPVLETPEKEVIQDTTIILDRLEQRFPQPSIYPATPLQKLVSLLLETYADEWLVIPAMHYRWAYQEVNQPFIYQQFGGLISPKLPRFVRGIVGKRLAARFKGALPVLGISERMIPAIEASYLALLADLNRHFKQHQFLLGAAPCIADFSFVGPFYAHLYRDPYPGKLMRERAPAVVQWVQRMISTQVFKGEMVADDVIPETLLPILSRMAHEQIPVLIDTDKNLSIWRREHNGQRIPRSIGEHKFLLDRAIGTRAMFPYALWKFKRPVDFYRSLPLDLRSQADDILQPLGFGDVLELGLANRLIRRNNRLQLVAQ